MFTNFRYGTLLQLVFLYLSVIFFCVSCGEDSSSGIFAPQFKLIGTAEGTNEEGTRAECSLDLTFELVQVSDERGGALSYRGTHGGGIQRTVLDPNRNGFSFLIDVHGAVEANIIPPNIGRIEIPVNVGSESRFYSELSAFVASMDDQGRGSGQWTCAPLDVDTGGYVDNSVIVTGEFRIEPMRID